MIVGNGLIAKAFEVYDHSQVLVFASGVSNSRLTEESAYQRERDLLLMELQKHPQLLLVYFSTYSIDDPLAKDIPYVKHKLEMEAIIKQQEYPYLIIRTGNISGKTGNPATLTNFFYNKVNSSEPFDCWKNASRNLIDIDHLAAMVTELVKEQRKNETIYLLSPVFYTAGEIVNVFEKLLQKKAVCNMLDKGEDFEVDTNESVRLFGKLEISQENYAERLIHKYYSHAG